ncbi:MAG: TIGR02266 family protein [Kofleriaceae bacterium]
MGQAKRTQVSLKIKFKSETLEAFIERYAVDVSQGGIFIRTKEPQAVGTSMKFEFQLKDQTPLIAGEGTVVWTRENDPTRPNAAPGMGVRFDKLADGSQEVLEKILAEKARMGPSRAQAAETKPPTFQEVPTRIAPSPLVDQLSSETKVADARARLAGIGASSGSHAIPEDTTPLPPPTPFQSDAGDFGDAAFSEATKIRTLDELVAQSGASGTDLAGARPAAGANDFASEATRVQTLDQLVAEAERSGGKSREASDALDEVAARRVSREVPAVSDAVAKDDAARPQPAAGEIAPKASAAAKAEAAKDTTEIPMAARAASAKAEPAAAAKAGPAADRTPRTTARPSSKAPPVTAAEAPPPTSSSSSSAIAVVLLLLVIGGGARWYFVLRKGPSATPPEAATGSAAPAAGSALPAAGSAAPTPDAAPPVPLVDTMIQAEPAGATITIVGADGGAAPLTAKLERDRTYKVTVAAPGMVSQELDVVGGTAPAPVALVAKDHVLRVESTPAGAQIWVDGRNTGKVTPSDLVLTATQVKRPALRVGLRSSGFAAFDTVVERAAFEEVPTAIMATVTATLEPKKAARPTTPATDKPATDKPATDKPATDTPATDKPATDKPATDKPATDKPATDKPATDKPATDKPATDKPATPATPPPAAPSATPSPTGTVY